MSYDLYLIDPTTKEEIEVEDLHYYTGGTYQNGGTRTLWFNITYNYSDILKKVLGEKGIRSLYDISAKDSITLLTEAINKLSDNKHPDYWKPTEGNVKIALESLVKLAKLAPEDAIWNGD